MAQVKDAATGAVNEVLKVSPPVAVTTVSFMGLAMQEWVYVLTAVYTAFQIIRLCPKMYRCLLCFCKEWKCPGTCKN